MVLPQHDIKLTGLRARDSALVEGTPAVHLITLLIIINSITLGLETNPRVMADHGPLLLGLDKMILLIFTVELLLKFYAYGPSFFRSGWNLFDFTIVFIAWLPTAGAFSILRALRVLRVFRLLSVVPQMRRVVAALLHSVPGMLSVGGILLLLFYVSAVLTTSLFGQHPDSQMQEWFGTVAASLYTLFQVMTLESWSMGIVRPTMELFPHSWLFFLPFIIITSFAVLNLFIGIIVDAMQTAQEEPRQQDRAAIQDFTSQELQQLNQRFDQLQQELASLKELLQHRP